MRPVHIIFSLPCGDEKSQNPPRDVQGIIAAVCCSFIASTIAYAASQSGGDPIDALVAQLKTPEPHARIAALRDLQTSRDPRIPDAMLPLLSDEGNSIRRLAARAIGSRWWQISKEKVP
ncbi:MAG: hypothetical protein DME75_09420, partial [Verrucomicrobia bacterium]